MKDLTGMRFGLLTVVKDVGRNKHGAVLWDCVCDCGGHKTLTGNAMKTGNTRSCGCLVQNRFRKLPDGEAAFRALLRVYKRWASKRGFNFELSNKKFMDLTQMPCHYCGSEPKNKLSTKKSGSYIYNGVDRIDNSSGYTEGNSVSCCKVCNKAKQQMSLVEFKEWVEKIYNHLNN